MAKERKLKVFLVDDNEMYLQMIEHHLKKNANLKLYSFLTGEECLSNLNKNPDIIVLDYYLDAENEEALNGVEILKQIKTLKPEIPVVMLTKVEDIEIAVNSIRAGAYDYVVKNNSAFTRIDNIINNIRHNISLEKRVTSYKTANNIIIAVLLIIIIGTLITFLMFPDIFGAT